MRASLFSAMPLCAAMTACATPGSGDPHEIPKANARHVRVVKPGMAVTMDYRIDRLTVMLDDSGKIESISCG